tara:strand:+ start:793 stop:936 length:144 start_codon:yes stop_codon:yes gene_type:complete
MAPVEVSRESPDGRDGETDHDAAAPPVEVGVTPVMATPLVNVRELGL